MNNELFSTFNVYENRKNARKKNTLTAKMFGDF